MWALSALCVLLPLVAASPVCDDATAQIFLSKTQLEGNLLDNFADKKFWFAASGSDLRNERSRSAEITYGSLVDDSVSGTFIWRDGNGDVVETVSSTYVVDGNRILSNGKTALYFIQCSENLMAAYRCQVLEESADESSMYYIWAPWDKTAADVRRELKSCKAEIRKEDPLAGFIHLEHP